MKRVFYIMPIVMLVMIACNNSTQKNDDQANQEKTVVNKEAVEGNHQHEEGTNKMILENGKNGKPIPKI